MIENPYQPPTVLEATVLEPSSLESESALRRAKVWFRRLLAVYALTVAGVIVATFALEPYLPVELQLYLEADAETVTIVWLLMAVVIMVPTLLLLLVGWVGMFFFWRPSRWLFLISQLLLVLGTALLGPSVMHGLEDALDTASLLAAGAIIGMAFFSPVRSLFIKPRGATHAK